MVDELERIKKFIIEPDEFYKYIRVNQDDKKYYILNRDKINKRNRERYKNDAEVRKLSLERTKKSMAKKRVLEGRVKTFRIKCECGQRVYEMNLDKHKNTKSHILKMACINYDILSISFNPLK